jgi:hypothetical protein
MRSRRALWLMRQLAPDYRTIAAFRNDIRRRSSRPFRREMGRECQIPPLGHPLPVFCKPLGKKVDEDSHLLER